MVDILILEELREYYRNNLDRYVKEHTHELIFLERGKEGINEHFGKSALEKGKNYAGFYGPTFFMERIPSHVNKRNGGLVEFTNETLEVCPNDSKTALNLGPIAAFHSPGEPPKYSQFAVCPECHYRAYMKPSEENIRRSEERMKKLIF